MRISSHIPKLLNPSTHKQINKPLPRESFRVVLLNNSTTQQLNNSTNQQLYKSIITFKFSNMKKTYRISLTTEGVFRITTPHDIDSCEEFIQLLHDKKIQKVSFKYLTILDEIPEFLNEGFNLTIDEIQPSHFEWLTDKAYGQHKFVCIESLVKEK